MHGSIIDLMRVGGLGIRSAVMMNLLLGYKRTGKQFQYPMAVSLAMSLANGSLLFPEAGDVGLPDWADGAVVAMHFSGYVE